MAIAEGAHPKAIQTRMGHSSIRVPLDPNGHLFPELVEVRQRRTVRTVVHASFGSG